MKPLVINLLTEDNAGIPLDFVVKQTRLIDGRKLLQSALSEASFDQRIKQELKKRRAQAEKEGKPLPETVPFEEGVEFLEEWYKDTVMPLADWHNKSATADDVYDAIVMGWKEARDRYDLPDEEYDKILDRLDKVREEWRDYPEPYIFQHKKTAEVLTQNEYRNLIMRIVDEDPGKQQQQRQKAANSYERYYIHKIGDKYGFVTEKEHLAGLMAWWLVAGMVGSAEGSRRPGVGPATPQFGSIRWMMARDTGAIAKPDPQLAAREKAARTAREIEKRQEKMGTLVGEIPFTGQGHIMRGAGGEATRTPSGSGGSVGRGEFTTGQASGPSGSSGTQKFKRKRPADGGGDSGGGSSGGGDSGGGSGKKFTRKKTAEEDLIKKLADAISEDPNDIWRDGSPVLDENWQDELEYIGRSTADYTDTADWVPSMLADMPDYYASVVENGPGRHIYLSRDMVTLQADPYAGIGDIMRADEVPGYVNDDDFILSGGSISIIDEDIDSYYNYLAEATPTAQAGTQQQGGAVATGVSGQQQGGQQQGTGAAPVNPQIDQAKKLGGKLINDLTAQLKILQQSPDWANVKADLVQKLKPFLG